VLDVFPRKSREVEINNDLSNKGLKDDDCKIETALVIKELLSY
jgi:hypothetical protein